MWSGMFNYLKTDDFSNGLLVEFGGTVIELILLSLLVPIVLRLYNRRRNRFNRYHGITILFGIYHESLDQLALLFNFDEIAEPVAGIETDPINRYWMRNSNTVGISYINSFYYGNLETKLFCLEHYCSRNNNTTSEIDKVKKIAKKLNGILKDFENYQFLDIRNDKLNQSIRIARSQVAALKNIIKENYNDPDRQIRIIDACHDIILLMLITFYDQAPFFDKFHRSRDLWQLIFRRPTFGNDEMMNRIRKKSQEYHKNDQGWSALFTLLSLLRLRRNRTPN